MGMPGPQKVNRYGVELKLNAEASHQSMLRSRSTLLSILFMITWVAVVALIYFGGPFWLVILLGLVGSCIALYDRTFVRQSVRVAMLQKERDK